MQRCIPAIALLACMAPAAAGEIRLDESMRSTLGAVIRAAGYNCPAAKLAYGEGEDAIGSVLQVYCGPAGAAGVYEKAVFRVTFRPGKPIPVVRPW